MEHAVQNIPDSLVYEVTEEGPIYYRGYRDYLSGSKTLEEIMGSSLLQSSIITDLVYVLISTLGKEHKVLSSELGIQFAKGAHRAADIAILPRERFAAVQDKRKYLGFPPDVVIEVDIKADLEAEDGPQDSFGYINTKTKELLKFGVKKVIWILKLSKV